MQTTALGFRAYLLALCAGVVCFYSAMAAADPPSRVARIGYMSGAVTFSPGGEDGWVGASVNRPMTTGDRVWADARARAEVQMGGAILRLNAFTGISLLNLDDQTAQVQLTQGVLSVNVRYLDAGQVFEIDTPNLAFVVRAPGRYRIEVDGDADATSIFVRSGEGEAYGDDHSYIIDAQQPYRFTGSSLRDYQLIGAPRPDEFESWAVTRDRGYDNSVSARYVSSDVIGYQDLDSNGTWRTDPAYGNVWYPSRVPSGWAPYRDGHWAWIDPWGWTWVDDAPWGFAVSHYGRWANMRGTWGWVPGPYSARSPRAERVYYAPALVGFVGGSNFQVTLASRNVGAVGWFPLGPKEVYRPSYAVSRGYFENINRSNTVVNTTVINNYYNNTNVGNVVYANRASVIAVPTTAFAQSQSVAKAVLPVSRETHGNAPVAFTAPVAPTERSVRGAQPQGSAPPPRSFQRPVVAHATPPPAHAGFAAQQQQLAAHPGMPLDDAARRQLRPVATVPVPVVKVIAQPQKAPPTAHPPAAGANAKPGEGAPGRGKPDDRKAPPTGTPPPAAAPGKAQLPGSAALPNAPPATVPAPPAPPAQPGQTVDPRNRNEPRGRPDARGDSRNPSADPRSQQAPVPPVQPPQTQPAPVPGQPVPPAARMPGAQGEPKEAHDPRDVRNRGEPHPQNAPVAQPKHDDKIAQPQPAVAPKAASKPPEEPRQVQPRERAPEGQPRQPQPRPERQEAAPKAQTAPTPPKQPEQQVHEKPHDAKPVAKPEEKGNEKGKREEENRKQKD